MKKQKFSPLRRGERQRQAKSQKAIYTKFLTVPLPGGN